MQATGEGGSIEEIKLMVNKSLLLLALGAALWVAPVASRPPAGSAASAWAANYGGGEIVGKVVNTANPMIKRRVQVLAGGREWTLHVPGNAPVIHAGKRVSMHDLSLGTYVRATGTRIGHTRLKADHVYVIGDRLALMKSGYGRRAGETGYFASYAGYRSRVRR
jgi:hypothetical protein